jgi:hypothetical protein
VSLQAILRETAYVASVTSTGPRGDPVYGAPVARKVRVEREQHMVLNARGEQVASAHRLWCLQPVNITDRVWLPGKNQNIAEQSLIPIAVSSASKFDGSTTLYRVDL